MASSLASYAFWLQHEYASISNSSLGEVRRDGWFEKRVSRLTKLIDTMGFSAAEVTTEVKRRYEEESRSGTVSKEHSMDLDFLMRGLAGGAGIGAEESS